MNVKEESEKVGLKLNIKKTKIMASSPITSCQIDGETMETVRDFILGGSKITADGDYSMKLKEAYSLEENSALPHWFRARPARQINRPHRRQQLQFS